MAKGSIHGKNVFCFFFWFESVKTHLMDTHKHTHLEGIFHISFSSYPLYIVLTSCQLREFGTIYF